MEEQSALEASSSKASLVHYKMSNALILLMRAGSPERASCVSRITQEVIGGRARIRIGISGFPVEPFFHQTVFVPFFHIWVNLIEPF